MSEIKRSKEEMSELKKILNVTDNVFEKKLKNWRDGASYEYQVDPNYLLDKLAELEGISHRTIYV